MDSPYDDHPPLDIPADVVLPAIRAAMSQDTVRGAWESPRASRPPAPPWPREDDPILVLLLWKYRANLAIGANPEAALLQLVELAWFEGGVAAYDQGQRDARRPRPVE